MKKLIPLLFLALLATACEKEPDLGKLDDNFVVYTNHDPQADFANLKTYYLPDSVMVISRSEKPEFWTGAKAKEIITAYVTNLTARGFTAAPKESAALGIQLSYVEDISYFVDFHNDYWWTGFPGYWDPWYWGNWYDWYYPYAIVYDYSVGSLLCEMVNLDAPKGDNERLPVIWNAYMSGLLSGSEKYDSVLTVQAINQSFVQSPYVKINK